MHIHLLLNHTALIEDNRKPTVTVSPPYAGTLTAEGIDYPIANYATVKGYKSVHVPSLGMPRDIDPDEADGKCTPEDFASSQCYRVDVYVDCIVLNGLSFSGTNATPVPLGTYKIPT